MNLEKFIPMFLPIASGLLTPQVKGAPIQMELSLPSDHPKAEALRKAVIALRTSFVEQKSGLEMRCLLKPGVVEEFLDVLATINPQAVERIRAEMKVSSKPLIEPDALIQLVKRARPIIEGK